MTFAGLVGQIIGIINLMVALLGSAALAIFVWGGVRYLYYRSGRGAQAGAQGVFGLEPGGAVCHRVDIRDIADTPEHAAGLGACRADFWGYPHARRGRGGSLLL